MVYIPAGPFTMGSDRGEIDETPVHTVNLGAFWMARTEVSNLQFSRFMRETGYKVEAFSRFKGHAIQVRQGKIAVVAGRENDPVTGIPWAAAQAYCAWAGRGAPDPRAGNLRLPTEAEWEKASRGLDGRKYPWGNAWEPGRANWGDPARHALGPALRSISLGDMVHITTPANTWPEGASPYGCLNMAGNAWEWCSSKYASYPYVAGDGREELQDPNCARVIRGGSALDHPTHLRCANRFRLYSQASLDVRFLACTGFRVAASAPTDGLAASSPVAPLQRKPAPYFQLLTPQQKQQAGRLQDARCRLKPGLYPKRKILGYPANREREVKYSIPLEHFAGLSTRSRREGLYDLDRYLRVRAGSTVADIGTGSGVLLPYLDAAVGNRGQIWATEISLSGLRCIQAWMGPAPSQAEDDLYYFMRVCPPPRSRVQLVLHDVQDCLLPAGQLDLACLIHVHYFFYPRAKPGVSPPRAQVISFYRSIARSLKPGGRMAILEWSEFGLTVDPEHGVLRAKEITGQMQEAGFQLELHKELIHHGRGYSEVPRARMLERGRRRNTLLIYRLKKP